MHSYFTKNCMILNRYETEGECEGEEECDKGQWFTTGWSDCSATECGEEDGEKKRKVCQTLYHFVVKIFS